MEGPSPRAARWLESGLLDVEFYVALRGREFSGAVEADEDFVDEGMRRLLGPHPFLDFVSLPGETRRAWRQGRVRQVLAQLSDGDGVMRPVSLAESAEPAAARAYLLTLAAQLGRETAADVDPDPRSSTGPPWPGSRGNQVSRPWSSSRPRSGRPARQSRTCSGTPRGTR